MLKVSKMDSGKPEIFRSIQGEGTNIGEISVFIRLSMCNLSCTWCDTPYTWDWRNHDFYNEVMEISIPQAEKLILGFKTSHLVITGGEPLLQQNELIDLTTALKQRGFFNEIETNGTIVPTTKALESISQWNVSLKTNNSGNKIEKRQISDALNVFRELNNCYFKFVVVNPEDIEEICRIVDQFHFNPKNVILMPEGLNSATISKRSEWVAEACINHGFNFSTRLHILLWGNVRGR